MRGVFYDNDFNKRGQTSRLVAGAQIQTSWNIEKNIHNYNSPLGWLYRRWDNVFCEPLVNSWLGNLGVLFCIVISIFSYSKIFLTLRYNHIQSQQRISQAQSNQATPLNMARYRKAVTSALWIQATLVVCCLPYLFAFIITPQGDPLPYYITRQSGLVFLYLNSSLNPLLYFWKIKEVRQAVKDTIKQVPCSIF